MGIEARQLHVFFFPLMAQGHMIPLIDIARLFATHGTKSTIVTTPVNALHFAESIERDRKIGLDIGVQIIPFPSVEAGLPDGCENANLVPSEDFVGNFFMAVGMLQQPLELLLEEHSPDCVVADELLPWATDAARKYGIPRLVFRGTSCFSVCVTANIKRYAPHEKVASNSEVFVVPCLPDQIEMMKSQLPIHADSHEPAVAEFNKKIIESEMKSFGILMNSFYELESAYIEYYTKVMGRKAWCIGPVSLYSRNVLDKAQRGKKSTIDEHHCLRWLNSKEPNSVIYVSFGSITRFSTPQLLEIAKGLEASKVPFIWVVRMGKNKENDRFLPEGFEERMDGKGFIIKDWAPQVLILDHSAVGGFMTHCGWNSTLEGISAGIPLITWPVFAEQFNNEKLVTQVLKIGIRSGNEVWNSWAETEHATVTKERIEEVVTQLMGKGEEAEDMRKRARELGEKAKKAVEKGGQSYSDLTAVIEELRLHSQPSI